MLPLQQLKDKAGAYTHAGRTDKRNSYRNQTVLEHIQCFISKYLKWPTQCSTQHARLLPSNLQQLMHMLVSRKLPACMHTSTAIHNGYVVQTRFAHGTSATQAARPQRCQYNSMHGTTETLGHKVSNKAATKDLHTYNVVHLPVKTSLQPTTLCSARQILGGRILHITSLAKFLVDNCQLST